MARVNPTCSASWNLSARLLEKSIAGSIRSAGGIRPILWDGQADAIEFGLRTTPVDAKLEPHRYALEYRVKLMPIGRAGAYRVQSEVLLNDFRVRTGKQKHPFKFLEREKLEAKIFDEEDRAFVAPEDSVVDDETFLSIAAGPFSRNRVLASVPRTVGELDSLSIPRRQPECGDSTAGGDALEKRIESDGQNLITVLHTLYTGDRDFKREINAAMKAAFGDDFEELVFPPAADQRIQLRVRWKSLPPRAIRR